MLHRYILQTIKTNETHPKKKLPQTACRKAAKALPAPQSCTTLVSWFATARSSPPQSLSLSPGWVGGFFYQKNHTWETWELNFEGKIWWICFFEKHPRKSLFQKSCLVNFQRSKFLTSKRFQKLIFLQFLKLLFGKNSLTHILGPRILPLPHASHGN